MKNKNDNITLYSWTTWKRNNPNLQLYTVRDGVKGWVRDTVCTTIQHHGWKHLSQAYDYDLFCDEKPKAMANRLIRESFLKNKDLSQYEFIYYPYYYTGDNSFMDCLYVYFKEKNL